MVWYGTLSHLPVYGIQLTILRQIVVPRGSLTQKITRGQSEEGPSRGVERKLGVDAHTVFKTSTMVTSVARGSVQ
jgi:hypothetical protein